MKGLYTCLYNNEIGIYTCNNEICMHMYMYTRIGSQANVDVQIIQITL